ncbi:MAG: hypothetical protein KY432_01635, partial [Acidobacteria bacterium]|nr:hypothetical protein [Acidobacteriota bacterium]
ISNEFDETELEGVDVRLHHQDDTKIATLLRASVDNPAGGEFRAGDVITVRMLLKPFRGASFERVMEMQLPESLQPGPLHLFVGSGSVLTRLGFMLVPPSPRNLTQVIDIIERLRPSTDIGVTAYVPGQGVVSGGVYLPELPPTMHLVTVEEKSEIGGTAVKYHPVRHIAEGTDYVITGAHRIDLKIEPAS